MFCLPAAAQLVKEACHFTGCCNKPLNQQQAQATARNAHTRAPKCLTD